MKPIKSLIAAVFTAVNLGVCVVFLTVGTTYARAQDSFKDVPPGDPAYRAITDFQKNDILIGYPDGFFSGKRVLTRYEFALAIKRAIENVILLSLNTTGKNSGTAQQVSPDEVQSFKRLVEEFSKDLAGLQVNVSQVKMRLDAMASRINSAIGRLDTTSKPGNGSFQGFVQPEPPRSVFTGLVGGFDRLPLITDSGMLSNGLNFTARIGSSTASLFANSYSGLSSFFSSPAGLRDSTSGQIGGAPLAITPPLPDNTVTPLTQSGTVATRSAGLRLTAPLFNSGTIGGTVIDFSSPAGVTLPSNEVIVGGINFNLNPIGKVSVSGGASRSVTQLDPGADPDNNAFNLNLRYESGPVGLLGGFQYIDPGYEAPGAWNRIGLLSNLTNVQGPFLRVNYNLNARTQFEIGSDLLAGARNRSYNFGGGLTTGFGTHDYISTLSAGMHYKLWHSTSLTADWEGVYWDLSAASSGLGAEAHPFESYINLGTGINLRGNAMLKMGYQIGSFGNFSGFGGLGPSGSGQSYNAFTTQLNVKF